MQYAIVHGYIVWCHIGSREFVHWPDSWWNSQPRLLTKRRKFLIFDAPLKLWGEHSSGRSSPASTWRKRRESQKNQEKRLIKENLCFPAISIFQQYNTIWDKESLNWQIRSFNKIMCPSTSLRNLSIGWKPMILTTWSGHHSLLIFSQLKIYGQFWHNVSMPMRRPTIPHLICGWQWRLNGTSSLLPIWHHTM